MLGTLWEKIGLAAKPIAGVVVAMLLVAQVATLGDTVQETSISPLEWVGIATAGVLAGTGALRSVGGKLGLYGRAILASAAAGLAALGTALVPAVENGPVGVSSSEWLGIFVALAVGGGLVAVVPNALRSTDLPTAARHAGPAEQDARPDGYTTVRRPPPTPPRPV